jgi:DNA-binding NarL/FixJ family response regulator
MTVRVLLADGHLLLRQRLRTLLEEHAAWRVVAEASDGPEAVRLAEEFRPDVAVIDVAMPLLNGLETTRRIVRRSPATRVIVLSVDADEAYVTQARSAGAVGFVLTDSADVDLLPAVEEVARGRPFISPAAAVAGTVELPP